MLAQLGYSPAKPLDLELVYSEGSSENRALVVQVQEDLHRVGIEVHALSQLSSIIYGGYAAGGTLSTGKYQLALSGWTAGIDPDDSSQFTCANRPPNGFNWSEYCSPQMDAAQAVAVRSYEQPLRTAAYATTQALLMRDAPQIFFWWPRYVQAINPDLHDFDPNPVVETWDIKSWSI
jgi:ABC-type transport system substrate-binding protein